MCIFKNCSVARLTNDKEKRAIEAVRNRYEKSLYVLKIIIESEKTISITKTKAIYLLKAAVITNFLMTCMVNENIIFKNICILHFLHASD